MTSVTIKPEHVEKYSSLLGDQRVVYGSVARLDEETWEIEFMVQQEGGQVTPTPIRIPLAHVERCYRAGTGATPQLAQDNEFDFLADATSRGWRP